MQDYNVTFRFTDEVLAQSAETLVAMPEPYRTALVAVLEIRLLVDGPDRALVETHNPRAPPTRTEFRFYYFEKENGRYLIDGIVRHLAAQVVASLPGPPPVVPSATPQASA
jgi:hypothetical protein